MNGVGPLEPGEGTHAQDARDTYDPAAPHPAHPRGGRAARLIGRRRGVVLTVATVAAALAVGGFLYAARDPQPPPPAPPFPSQVVDVSYLDAVAPPSGSPPRSFSFAVLVDVDSGPPVTVDRISQPYAGLSVTATPRTPFRTEAGSARKVILTLHVTECGKAPVNAGLPFLDVTLRNARAREVHSFILGTRYARALSESLRDACDAASRS
ncbi:Tat pathway signal sequence domain protein [Streptomyces sp. NPDC046985]|uniref:Tat pathway signal sequence domain protein n=1 Tax=Streptomyces sp. NPDC046985 TaxID=3155377 RepID=UPI0033C56C95